MKKWTATIIPRLFKLKSNKSAASFCGQSDLWACLLHDFANDGIHIETREKWANKWLAMCACISISKCYLFYTTTQLYKFNKTEKRISLMQIWNELWCNYHAFNRCVTFKCIPTIGDFTGLLASILSPFFEISASNSNDFLWRRAQMLNFDCKHQKSYHSIG